MIYFKLKTIVFVHLFWIAWFINLQVNVTVPFMPLFQFSCHVNNAEIKTAAIMFLQKTKSYEEDIIWTLVT